MTSIVLGAPPANPKATWENDYEAGKPREGGRLARGLAVGEGPVESQDPLGHQPRPHPGRRQHPRVHGLRHGQRRGRGPAAYGPQDRARGLRLRAADPLREGLVRGRERDRQGRAGRDVPRQRPRGCCASSTTRARPCDTSACRRPRSAPCPTPATPCSPSSRTPSSSSTTPTSTAKAELALPDGLPASQVHLRPNADGTSFLLSNRGQGPARRARGRHLVAPRGRPVRRPEPERRARRRDRRSRDRGARGAHGRRRASRSTRASGSSPQAPRLSLNPNQPNDAWSFKAGEAFEIVLAAVSVGGPAKEIGPVRRGQRRRLDQGPARIHLGVPSRARNEGQAEFEVQGRKAVASLPDFRVPAGVEPIKNKEGQAQGALLGEPRGHLLDHPPARPGQDRRRRVVVVRSRRLRGHRRRPAQARPARDRGPSPAKPRSVSGFGVA